MVMNKLGVMLCLDKYVMTCSYEGVVACLDNNNKNDFDVGFLHVHPLEYIIEVTLGGQCIFHYGYIKKIVLSGTYLHFCH